MKSRLWNINGIFCALALVCLTGGCKTTEEKKAAKDQALIKVHLESVKDNKSDQGEATVFRENPVAINIDSKELLNNLDIVEAGVVDVPGGFGMRISFGDHGKRVLENVTARNQGKRLVIFTAFPEVRWLAAPRITHRISDGVLVFTPDATREESDKIVRGINNVSKKIAKGQMVKGNW